MPIHPTLVAVLQQLEQSADGRVFHSARGCVVNPDNVRAIFIRDVVEKLKARFPTKPNEIGFCDGRLHSFRHTFISEAFLGGAGEGEIREWVGHADSQIVERYRHLQNDDAQRKMAKIDFLGESENNQLSGPAQPTASPAAATDDELTAVRSASDVPDAA